jgi:hypothetical protein
LSAAFYKNVSLGLNAGSSDPKSFRKPLRSIVVLSQNFFKKRKT